MRYGGTPSGPGDLRRDALARDRSSVTVGGGRSSKRGRTLTQSSARADQGLFLCRMRCILRVGVGSVDGVGGVSSVCFTRR